MNEQWTIAIDADGVITDFEKKLSQINGRPFQEISRGRLWRSVEEYDENVMPFFESLEKLPDADVLMNFVKQNFINYFILTASGYVPKDGEQQKKNWFRKNYGPELVVKVVRKSGDKAAFAGEKVILIDDRSKSIDPWIAAGGVGILHTSAADTIKQLKQICSIK